MPWTTRAVAAAEVRLALGLLGPGRAQRLQERVDRTAVSRTDLAEAVDAERRRIERDLHDGIQQRLVSLAVNLGLALTTRSDLPSDAREAIATAHREAKEAIAELGGLVRGLHPAVLEERGLDAAVSGLAKRVGSVDGIFRVSSPAGGPTTITAELPSAP